MNALVSIEKAASLEDEQAFLSKVCESLKDHEPKLVYADWLEERGDEERANFLRGWVVAMRSGDSSQFPDFGELPLSWLRVSGAVLCKAILDHGDLMSQLNEILDCAMPCLIFDAEGAEEWSNDMERDPDVPVGATKFFGIPDLPADMPWPTQKDCQVLFDPKSDIDPATSCSFVCQINFEDFAGTQAARFMPERGLLSIFSCSEMESIGMTDGYVSYTEDISTLRRAKPPAGIMEGDENEDESNMLRDSIEVQFTEAMDIPSCSDISPFPVFKRNYDDPLEASLTALREDIGTDGLHAVLGFTQPTSGDDPLPGAGWCKMICAYNSYEIRLHFCIKTEDLKAAKFDDVKLAWVDFD